MVGVVVVAVEEAFRNVKGRGDVDIQSVVAVAIKVPHKLSAGNQDGMNRRFELASPVGARQEGGAVIVQSPEMFKELKRDDLNALDVVGLGLDEVVCFVLNGAARAIGRSAPGSLIQAAASVRPM